MMTRESRRVVVPSTTARDAVIAAVTGLLVLGFIAYGIAHFASISSRAKNNTVTGTIIEKQFLPAPEQQITFGRQGLKERRTEGEYLFKARVDAEGGRIFEVPVEKPMFEAKNIGDSLTFLRPRSERN